MDYSQNVPPAAPLEKGKRRSKIQHGESKKRGCLCHFMVRIAGSNGSIAELRMYRSDHHNAAGAVCHGLQCGRWGTHHTAPYLSAACRAFVTDALLNDVPPDSIVSRVREQLHHKYMVAHNLPSIESAQLAMQVTQFLHNVRIADAPWGRHILMLLSACWQGKGRGNPRDYYIDTKDVFNIKAQIEQLSWRHDPDQATSVRAFTQLNPDNILLYQEVEPLPGQCFPFYQLLMGCLQLHPHTLACAAQVPQQPWTRLLRREAPQRAAAP